MMLGLPIAWALPLLGGAYLIQTNVTGLAGVGWALAWLVPGYVAARLAVPVIAAALDEEGNVHRAGACVASGPRLAGTSVGRMAVSTQRLSIHPGVGDGVNGLSAIQAATDGSSIQGRPYMGLRTGWRPLTVAWKPRQCWRL